MISRSLIDANVRRCRKCIIPEVKGHIELDEEGVCRFCRDEHGEKKTDSSKTFEEIPAEKKRDIFRKKLERYRGSGDYDCIVAVSGGKDSIMTLYIASQMGLRPLALFIDNGFALPEMYSNIRNAVQILGIDSLTYRVSEMSALFETMLKSKKHIYYCRVCHILLEKIIKDMCLRYDIRLVLGGYTKGQSYLKDDALSWIFEESDRNTLEIIRSDDRFNKYLELFENPIGYSAKHYRGIVQISPFKYIKYDEQKIIKEIEEKLKFKLPEKSWPAHSTNCAFNYVSQYLAVKQFGYSQHETEFSHLIRSKEMQRDDAIKLISTPITEDDLKGVLENMGIDLKEIIDER